MTTVIVQSKYDTIVQINQTQKDAYVQVCTSAAINRQPYTHKRRLITHPC